jgi:hypothetical protein
VLYRLGLTPGAALDRLRRDAVPVAQVKELIAFLETAKRGTLGAPGSADTVDGEEEED